MKRIQYILLTLGIIAGFGLAILPSTASAVSACDINPDSVVCKGEKDDDVIKYVKIIVNTLLYVLGTVSVVVIIIAGIGYTTSTGDPAAITKAKSTLTYAVIGLVVAILAYAIVNFVIGIFNTTPAINTDGVGGIPQAGQDVNTTTPAINTDGVGGIPQAGQD
ncbi:MAG TPA: pilin [Candidatus Angelobacter sp.]|nr:pilin [Candidatus Angelobacter sp.]